VSFLEYYRSVLVRKAEGISEEQARRTIEPSDLSLIGLIRHMAEVERNWFRRRFAAHDAPPLYYGPHDEDGDLHTTEQDTLDDAFAALAAEIAFARDVVASTGSLDDLAAADPPTQHIPGWRPNLRWVLVHMIEEYARHCGHADLLRQRIDGAVGD
jgi:uncharacterized damage-inducible protein DinB